MRYADSASKPPADELEAGCLNAYKGKTFNALKHAKINTQQQTVHDQRALVLTNAELIHTRLERRARRNVGVPHQRAVLIAMLPPLRSRVAHPLPPRQEQVPAAQRAQGIKRINAHKDTATAQSVSRRVKNVHWSTNKTRAKLVR